MASSKHNGFFIELSDPGFILARTTGYGHPMTVEEIREASADDDGEITRILERMGRPSGASGYTRARCGVYPKGRVLGKLTVDEPRKARDPQYLEEKVKSDFNIDPRAYTLAILNSRTGAPADVGSLMEKEFFLCGAPAEAFEQHQRELLQRGIYPDRLELGSVATLGALVDYHRSAEIEHPTLVLEVGMTDTRLVVINGGAVDTVRAVPHGLQSMVAVVQRDLGLKDNAAAKRLLYSDSFDFKEMGPKLVDRLLRELQSTIGYYEVQTGLSVGQVFCTKNPEQLSWLNKTFAKSLNVDPLTINYSEWLERNEIRLGGKLSADAIPSHWLGLFGLMIESISPQDEKN